MSRGKEQRSAPGPRRRRREGDLLLGEQLPGSEWSRSAEEGRTKKKKEERRKKKEERRKKK